MRIATFFADVHLRSTALLLWAVSVACVGLTDPALPRAAERFTPPPVYARWWAMTEACSAITRPLDHVEFYVVPNASSVPAGPYGEVAGYWSMASNRIVLAEPYVENGRTVRHEMLHALLRSERHPPAYFQGRCEGVVSCREQCEDEGPPPVLVPAFAPVLSISALDIEVDVVPQSVSRDASDDAFSVVVRVTNRTEGPVWVQLERTPSLPGDPAYAGGFGFQLLPVGHDAGVAGMQQSILAQPVPFMAGETRQSIIDLNARWFTPGGYLALGLFNIRQDSVSFRVLP